MTNAATGHAISGRNKGWRKAVRFALTENPISGDIPQSTRIETPLFVLNEEETAWARKATRNTTQQTKSKETIYQV